MPMASYEQVKALCTLHEDSVEVHSRGVCATYPLVGNAYYNLIIVDYTPLDKPKTDEYTRTKAKPYVLQQSLHRIVYFLAHGDIPEGYGVDHINRDIGDNRPENLRLVTKQLNAQNQAFKATNKLGLIGVSFEKATGKYRAEISIPLTDKEQSVDLLGTSGVRTFHAPAGAAGQSKTVILGRFKTREAATYARVCAERNVYTHRNMTYAHLSAQGEADARLADADKFLATKQQ